MKKVLASVILLLFPLIAMGQAVQKIAYVDSQGILMDMPETKKMQTELETLSKKYEDTLLTMRQELQKKYEEYVAEEKTMIETIKLRKQQDIEEIQKRIEELMGVAQQDVQKKQVELLTPIQQKLKAAIDKVGAAKGFAYILDAQLMLYVGPDGVNATPDVRKELGLSLK